MKRFSSVVVLALGLVTVACSGSSSSPDNAAGSDGGSSSTATSTDTAALDAACGSTFDALLARTAKCGPGSTMNLVAVERSRPSFAKLCQVQGSRPGTGYTAAFRASCADALANAACDDDDTVVKACWEPHGALTRGLPCNTDDQCQDGFCQLPSGAASGSSCGVCGTPAWKQADQRCDSSDQDKCEPGTVCGTYSGPDRSCRRVLGAALGATCGSSTTTCRSGLDCKSPASGSASTCVEGTRAAVGATCDYTTQCAVGTACVAKACANIPVLDEKAGMTYDANQKCDSWTVASATGKCVVKDALSCN